MNGRLKKENKKKNAAPAEVRAPRAESQMEKAPPDFRPLWEAFLCPGRLLGPRSPLRIQGLKSLCQGRPLG